MKQLAQVAMALALVVLLLGLLAGSRAHALTTDNLPGGVAQAGTAPVQPLSEPLAPASNLCQNYASNGDFVAFVGKTWVDLSFGSGTPGGEVRIIRNGSLVQTFPGGTTDFWTDESLAPSTTYTYNVQHCSAPQGTLICSYMYDNCAVKTGTLRGRLMRDLALGGEYSVGEVIVLSATTTLSIEPGAHLDGGNIYGKPGLISSSFLLDAGKIVVSGATLHGTTLTFDNTDDSLVNSTLDQHSVLYLQGDYTIAGSTFANNSFIVVRPGEHDAQPRVFINDNEFHHETVIQTFQQSEATVGSNTGGGLHMSALVDSKLTVEDNTFYSATIVSLNSSATGIVRRNTFSNTEPHVTSGVVQIGGAGAYLIENNAFEVTQDWYNAGTYAVHIGSGTSPAGVVRNNTISRHWRGIIVSGAVTPEISGNQLIKNHYGLYVDGNGAPVILNNCFVGNGPLTGQPTGAALTYLNRTARLNVATNFWGHPSGPTHPNNPGGTGDRIEDPSLLVDFQPVTLSCAAGAKDLWPGGLEAVQVIQTLGNDVPWVAGKQTVVRVYPQNSLLGAVFGVTGRLTAYRNGSTLQPVLTPADSAIAATPDTSWDTIRRDSVHSLDFALSKDWCQGTIDVAVELNPGHQIAESDYANNAITRTLTFHAQSVPRIAIVPIVYKSLFPDQPPALGALEPILTLARAIFPVPDIEFIFLPPLPWDRDLSAYGANSYKDGKLLAAVLGTLRAELNRDRPAAERFDSVLGLLDVDSTAWGATLRDQPASWAPNNPSLAAWYVADLFGVSYGGMFDNWPYADNTIQEYGYDTSSGKIVPRTTPELMRLPVFDVADRSPWLSPYTYGRLFTNLAPSLAVQSAAGIAEQPYLLVSGWITATGKVAFNHAWQVASTTDLADPPFTGTPGPNTYCLDLIASGGSVLYTNCFDRTFVDPATGYSLAGDSFSSVMPLGAGTQAVALRKGSTELGRVTASAHQPTVVAIPITGAFAAQSQIDLYWAGTDLDGNTLRYNVLYSTDNGTTWWPVLIDTPNTSHHLDLAQVPAGTALVRIEASDGFHTTHIDLGPFAAPDVGPWIGIAQPEHWSTVTSPLRLEGSAYDTEDGVFIHDGLIWSSDRDGDLGSGSVLTLTSLSPGEHTLTLRASDSEGHTNSTSIVVSTQAIADTPITGLAANNNGPSPLGTLTHLSAAMATGTHCTFTWNFGDGTTGTSAELDHLYAVPGTYTATVTAHNSIGDVSASTQVQVTNAVGPGQGNIWLPLIRR